MYANACSNSYVKIRFATCMWNQPCISFNYTKNRIWKSIAFGFGLNIVEAENGAALKYLRSRIAAAVIFNSTTRHLGLYVKNHSMGTAQDSGGILKRVSEKRFVRPLTRLYIHRHTVVNIISHLIPSGNQAYSSSSTEAYTWSVHTIILCIICLFDLCMCLTHIVDGYTRKPMIAQLSSILR